MTIRRRLPSLTGAVAVSAAALLFTANTGLAAPSSPRTSQAPNVPQPPPPPPPSTAPTGQGQTPEQPPAAPGAPPAPTGTATSTLAAPAPANDLMAVLSRDPSLSTFTRLLREAGLTATLSGAGSGPYTLFAPSNSAFSRYPATTMAWLERPENRAYLTQLLRNHIVTGKLTKEELRKGGPGGTPPSLRTLAGTTLPVIFASQSRVPSVGRANLVHADMAADNGILHITDGVQWLPLSAAGQNGAPPAPSAAPAAPSSQPAADAAPPAPAPPPANGGGS